MLTKTLDDLCLCFNDDGNRTAEGHRLHEDHYTGAKAWFSDESEGNKQKFKKELTVNHPEKPGETILCPWHGKVKTPQIRIHFSWPIVSEEPVYVVYVGPKITKN